MPRRIDKTHGPKRASVSLKLPTELYENLKLFSEMADTSMNTLMIEALYHYMADGHALKQAIAEKEKAIQAELESMQAKMDSLAAIQVKISKSSERL